MDVFSSQSKQWVRHGLQLDHVFIEGFKRFKLCRYFVYLRVEDVDVEMNPTMGMRCLGVSKDLLCYVHRDISNTFQFWCYEDKVRASGGDHQHRWTLKYSVSGETLGKEIISSSLFYRNHDTSVLKPYAISPVSHVLLYGNSNLILSYSFEAQCGRVVHHSLRIAPPGDHPPLFTQRACLIPFYDGDDRRNAAFTPIRQTMSNDSNIGAESSSAEVKCECDKQKDDWRPKWFCDIEDNRPFVQPNEMQLFEGVEEMHI